MHLTTNTNNKNVYSSHCESNYQKTNTYKSHRKNQQDATVQQNLLLLIFLNCTTCFGRHTVLHQEPKICNCSLWIYIRFWWSAAAMAEKHLDYKITPFDSSSFTYAFQNTTSKTEGRGRMYTSPASCYGRLRPKTSTNTRYPENVVVIFFKSSSKFQNIR